jgi:hypothetical protein
MSGSTSSASNVSIVSLAKALAEHRVRLASGEQSLARMGAEVEAARGAASSSEQRQREAARALAEANMAHVALEMECEGVRLFGGLPEALGVRVGDLVLDAEPETEVERRKLLLMRAVALEHRETRGLPVALLLLLTEEEGVAWGVEEAHR